MKAKVHPENQIKGLVLPKMNILSFLNPQVSPNLYDTLLQNKKADEIQLDGFSTIDLIKASALLIRVEFS